MWLGEGPGDACGVGARSVRKVCDKEKVMKPAIAASAVAAFLAGLLAVTAAATGASTTMKAPAAPVLAATFPGDTLAESLAIDGQGNMYVTVTDQDITWTDGSGRLVRIAPDGSKTQLGRELETGGCCLTGVALDGRGRIYVADATQAESMHPAVYRLDPGGWTEVLRLPTWSFPNGLAFHGRWLYVSDSTLGAVWRTDPASFTDDTDGTPWLQDTSLLAPAGFGANGLAFFKDDLYVAVADAGSILRVPIASHGSPGTPSVVVQDPALVTADGISFDQKGNLYATVNASNSLWRLTPKGTLEQISTGIALSYPTFAVFGTTKAMATTLYVENGVPGEGYADGPYIIALDIGTGGAALPS
jgi:sugar lactone lactonase YvrE